MHVNVRAYMHMNVRACMRTYVRTCVCATRSCNPFMRPQEGGPALKIARVSNANNFVPGFLHCIVGVQKFRHRLTVLIITRQNKTSRIVRPSARPPCWSPKSQCVYGPENEIAAVTFFAKTGAALTNSSALASPTERQDPGQRLLIEGLIAPPGAKEHVANLCHSTMLCGIVGVVGAGVHTMAWVRCWFRCDIAGRMPFLRLPWQWIVLSWSGIALLSFVLVSWCIVCFWAPPLPPPRLACPPARSCGWRSSTRSPACSPVRSPPC